MLGVGERRPNPDILQDESNRELLRNFITRTHAIMTLIFRILNDKVGLPPETFQNLHRLEGIAGDQARWLYVSWLGQRKGIKVMSDNLWLQSPPKPENTMSM
jgi:hypothetical protein